jgi:hypothetical protein
MNDKYAMELHSNSVGICGMAKISADLQTWKLSNTMRRAVLKKIGSLSVKK